jgi:hypothetical protein
VGHTAEPGVVPVQRPFAAVLGCSDARAPVETIFEQRSNDLFVVRVAGNGVGSGSQPGYRDALVEASVALNACLSAFALKQELAGSRVRVLFGRYDLARRSVGLPLAPVGRPRSSGVALSSPPDGVDGLQDLTIRVARSGHIASLLRAGSDAAPS